MPNELKHPTQPIYRDREGVNRFHGNAIVRTLLKTSRLDLNDIAELPFKDADRIQLMQLLGYSLAGFGELGFVTNEEYERAEREGLYKLHD